MTKARPIAAADCETDPFKKGRVPVPFIWGYYDKKGFLTFNTTREFVDFIKKKRIILFAHNGGKFDFVFLLEYVPLYSSGRIQIINGRIVSMMIGDCELRDSFAIMPVKLAALGAKKEIDYVKLERENRHKHADEIRDYLRVDCVVLYDAVAAYRIAAGKHKTIASNALAFSRKLGLDLGKSNHRFDSEYRKFYFGGRTECFKPGEHRNLIMLDIHSAYPDAMMKDHCTGTHFECESTLKRLSRDQIERSFIELECYSHGAFPLRSDTGAQGLSFPKAAGEYFVTGWEYIAAKDLGLIHDEKILMVHSTTQTINFAPYVNHWYEKKLLYSKRDANGDRVNKAEYEIAKCMMNSLYGKAAQNPGHYFDYKIMPAGSPLPCLKFRFKRNSKICKNCGMMEDDHGYSLAQEYDKFEFHYRECLWKHKYKHGANWQAVPIYKNVATGASITGCVRAKLLRAIHSVGVDTVIYTDTDSIIATSAANLSGISITEKLGDWELEDRSAPVGHFAGKKLYAIQMTNKDKSTGKHKVKIASKGSKLTFEEVKKVSKGGTVVWESEAPNFNTLGAIMGKKDPKTGLPIPKERLENDDPKRRHSVDDGAKFIVRSIRATAQIRSAPN